MGATTKMRAVELPMRGRVATKYKGAFLHSSTLPCPVSHITHQRNILQSWFFLGEDNKAGLNLCFRSEILSGLNWGIQERKFIFGTLTDS